MKIFKYRLNYHSYPEIVRLPRGAQIGTFDIQLAENGDGSTVLWALIDENEEIEERVFMIAMTGQEIPGNVTHIYNTVQFPGGLVGTLVELDKNTKAFDPASDDRIS